MYYLAYRIEAETEAEQQRRGSKFCVRTETWVEERGVAVLRSGGS